MVLKYILNILLFIIFCNWSKNHFYSVGIFDNIFSEHFGLLFNYHVFVTYDHQAGSTSV